MPESVYKRRKERAIRILDETYIIAKTLGYLQDYRRENIIDILLLREEKYYKPEKFLEVEKNIKPIPIASEKAQQLFILFYDEKRKIDPMQKVPSGEPKNIHLRALDQLLKERSFEDIVKVIRWGLSKSFWCSRITTPSKLREVFSEARNEMVIADSNTKENVIETNKHFAQSLLNKVRTKLPNFLRVEILNNYVELLVDGSPQATTICYNEKGFKDLLESTLQKCGVATA